MTKIFYHKQGLTHSVNYVVKEGLRAERIIHMAVFALLLIGFLSVSAWISLTYLNGDIILEIAGVTLSWGVVLLILYVSFKKLGWNWWSPI